MRTRPHDMIVGDLECMCETCSKKFDWFGFFILSGIAVGVMLIGWWVMQ